MGCGVGAGEGEGGVSGVEFIKGRGGLEGEVWQGLGWGRRGSSLAIQTSNAQYPVMAF